MLDLLVVLGLSPSQEERSLSLDVLKAAYRRALLRAHPDKAPSKTTQEEQSYSVDEVTLAYKILSDPIKRSEYLKQRRLQPKSSHSPDGHQAHSIDSVDLDDFTYNSVLSLWTRACRCGALHGFSLTDDDLDKEANSGVILVGCQDCSIWLQVHFQAVDELDAGTSLDIEDKKDS